jgi:hypothetical protein
MLVEMKIEGFEVGSNWSIEFQGWPSCIRPGPLFLKPGQPFSKVDHNFTTNFSTNHHEPAKNHQFFIKP